MVRFHLAQGKKSHSDILVKVYANGEVLTFQELLFILKHYLDSEDQYYPVQDGYLGRGLLLGAISCIACGVPMKTVLLKFKLPIEQLEVFDERKP